MTPIDSFDIPVEGVEIKLMALNLVGQNEVSVRGTEVISNSGNETCSQFFVAPGKVNDDGGISQGKGKNCIPLGTIFTPM